MVFGFAWKTKKREREKTKTYPNTNSSTIFKRSEQQALLIVHKFRKIIGLQIIREPSAVNITPSQLVSSSFG